MPRDDTDSCGSLCVSISRMKLDGMPLRNVRLQNQRAHCRQDAQHVTRQHDPGLAHRAHGSREKRAD